LKEIHPMSTASVTTPVGSVGRQVTDIRVRNWLLAALTVSSGAVDAISFLALGKIFTAFMTGNVAFLGMGLAGHPGAPPVVSLLAAMAGFPGGGYVGTKIIKRSSQTPAPAGGQPACPSVPRHDTLPPAISALPRPR